MSKLKWTLVIGGVVLILGVGVVLVTLVPTRMVTYTINEQYQDTESYYENEPYTTQEAYTEQEVYYQATPIDYVVTKTETYSYLLSTGFNLRVWIQNADTKSGDFLVFYDMRLKGGATTNRSESQYVAIGETKMIEAGYSGGLIDTGPI